VREEDEIWTRDSCACCAGDGCRQPSAYGWLRPLYEDATVWPVSELIVIGHLKDGSLEYVPTRRTGMRAPVGSIMLDLVITKVLKAKTDEEEIPLIIHYGLGSRGRGYVKREVS